MNPVNVFSPLPLEFEKVHPLYDEMGNPIGYNLTNIVITKPLFVDVDSYYDTGYKFESLYVTYDIDENGFIKSYELTADDTGTFSSCDFLEICPKNASEN